MFFVDLGLAANNKEFYKLEYVKNTKIRVEAPRILILGSHFLIAGDWNAKHTT
jgi:hypothetical protein